MPGQKLQAGMHLPAKGLCHTQDDAPASVPHRLPSPPMMTASNPKIRRLPPMAGSNEVRMPRKTPAIAVTASDSAMASPKTCARFSPISWAISCRSEVARKARPSAVR